jgi:glycosyltransferase involved in cell wall biosynthesis
MVSVVIACRNSVNFIVRALESVLSQAEQGDEIIFVDDHSVDGSYELVHSKYKDNSAVKIFKSPGNGISSARNYGNAQVKNDYIFVLDSDDYLRHDALYTVRKFILKFPTFDVFYGDICIGIKDKVVPYFSYPEYRNRKCAKRRIMAFPVVPFKHSAVIYRKHAFDTVGGYDETLSSKVDIDLALRMVVYTAKIKKINSYLTVHQKHSDQLSTSRIRGMINFKKVFWKHELNYFKRIVYLSLRFASEFLKQFVYLKKK